MADAHGGDRFAGTAPKLAVGAAAVALLTSLAAVIVVVSRGGEAVAPAPGSGSAGDAVAAGSPPPPAARRVAAAEVVKLSREAVALVRQAGKVVGVKVTDDDVRQALELEPDDVITALSGRAIEREYDVHDAVFGLKRLRASTVYVELLRGGEPVLVRWQIDGDLHAARPPRSSAALGSVTSRGSRGSLTSRGSLGGLGGLGVDPSAGLAADPLADTIKKIDDLNYVVPRTTIERVFASTSTYARVARTWPSRRTGGFQVFGVRPGTIVAAIGIASGDSIRAINGHVVRSIDEAVELYRQIKDEKEWRIDLDRRGRPALITITIN